MRGLSIRLKMTLWFGLVSLIIVGITYSIVLLVSSSVMQKSIRDHLIQTVEDNLEEIEYSNKNGSDEEDTEEEQLLLFRGKYLEIEDEFIEQKNGVYTALYDEYSTKLYGINPIGENVKSIAFLDEEVQKHTIHGITWYLYDRRLTGEAPEGLWLRGVVSIEQGTNQLSSIIKVSLFLIPVILLLGVAGGYMIAGRTLKPIKQIAETASHITQGADLRKRIHLGEGQDEVHQLADAFDAMFERLDQSFQTERQFTSDASHELRTPMSVIMAQCEYSLEQDRSPQEYKEALLLIKRQGNKMTRLIADMLTFTRLEGKSEHYQFETLNLSDLVASVCQDMALLKDKNITLAYEVQPEVYVKGNVTLLTRLLTNLITNAYRYGKENGHIHVQLKKESNQIILAVEDDGIGIAKEEQDKIFGRFYQSDRARASAGTGLGLAMVKEIAEIHGGKVVVESKLGVGSKFQFLI